MCTMVFEYYGCQKTINQQFSYGISPSDAGLFSIFRIAALHECSITTWGLFLLFRFGFFYLCFFFISTDFIFVILLLGQSGFCTPIHIFQRYEEKCILFFNDSLPVLFFLSSRRGDLQRIRRGFSFRLKKSLKCPQRKSLFSTCVSSSVFFSYFFGLVV